MQAAPLESADNRSRNRERPHLLSAGSIARVVGRAEALMHDVADAVSAARDSRVAVAVRLARARAELALAAATWLSMVSSRVVQS
jgi:hypothetical protein